MKLAIYDKGGGNFGEKARPAAIEVYGEPDVPRFDPTIAEAVDKLREFSHIVCHLTSDREDPSWHKLMEGKLSGVKVIIRVSSQGASGMGDSFKPPYRLNGTGPWVLHLIERSADVGKEQWKGIFNALKMWEADKNEPSIQVAAIFDPHPEARLALRLLCEAWVMNSGQKEKSHEGILIHAPVHADDWFDPFVEGFRQREDDAKRAAASEGVEKIAEMMGDAQADARRFFKRLAELYASRSNALVFQEFDKDINDLCKKMKQAEI